MQPKYTILTLSGQNFKMRNNMSKTLRVIDSFFVAEVGDIFTISEDGNTYVLERNEEFHKAGDMSELNSSYQSTFSISVEYAKELIKEGYLEEGTEKKSSFVNVFDEIDNLINKYQTELSGVDEEFKNSPQCLKVEKVSVLSNILSVLKYLKTLRK